MKHGTRRYHWLSRRAFHKGTWRLDVRYIAAQLSLDLCGWQPTHSVIKKLPFSICGVRGVQWYAAGPIPHNHHNYRRRMPNADKRKT